MQKGESVVSIALAAVILLTVIAVQHQWNPASLKDVAHSAADFILTTAGMGGQVPEIAGYQRLKTFQLGKYRAGLYRVTPAPVTFAPGRLVIYDESGQPVFRLETLEGSKDSWSALYDFNGRHGLTVEVGRTRPAYTRDLSGDGIPEVIVGQYTGGDHCCAVATVLELGKDAVAPLGRIDGIDGLPFEGLEVRKLIKGASWQIVAHRPYTTTCGTHYEAADVLSVYAFAGGRYEDQTASYGDFLQDVLRQNLAKWRQDNGRNLDLLQTVAVDYAVIGQKEAGLRFFALNLSQLLPGMQSHNVDPNACLDAIEGLIDRVPVAQQ